MNSYTFAFYTILICFFASVAFTTLRLALRTRMLLREPQGWLWFSSDPKKEDRVRIGVTDADPDTFLPPSVVLLYKQPVKDQKKATSDIESNLKEAKISGAWYDANSAQAYISHLRDEW